MDPSQPRPGTGRPPAEVVSLLDTDSDSDTSSDDVIIVEDSAALPPPSLAALAAHTHSRLQETRLSRKEAARQTAPYGRPADPRPAAHRPSSAAAARRRVHPRAVPLSRSSSESSLVAPSPHHGEGPASVSASLPPRPASLPPPPPPPPPPPVAAEPIVISDDDEADVMEVVQVKPAPAPRSWPPGVLDPFANNNDFIRLSDADPFAQRPPPPPLPSSSSSLHRRAAVEPTPSSSSLRDRATVASTPSSSSSLRDRHAVASAPRITRSGREFGTSTPPTPRPPSAPKRAAPPSPPPPPTEEQLVSPPASLCALRSDLAFNLSHIQNPEPRAAVPLPAGHAGDVVLEHFLAAVARAGLDPTPLLPAMTASSDGSARLALTAQTLSFFPALPSTLPLGDTVIPVHIADDAWTPPLATLLRAAPSSSSSGRRPARRWRYDVHVYTRDADFARAKKITTVAGAPGRHGITVHVLDAAVDAWRPLAGGSRAVGVQRDRALLFKSAAATLPAAGKTRYAPRGLPPKSGRERLEYAMAWRVMGEAVRAGPSGVGMAAPPVTLVVAGGLDAGMHNLTHQMHQRGRLVLATEWNGEFATIDAWFRMLWG
ncbi:hypothetical protein H9P43_002685 [Blastocladiella emersonii ATCC 22665]|nr:hypothetical protein H9P43_002685 [Blastocladiella emersonii ATCC 22665]